MIFISAGHHEIAQGASFNDVTEFKLTVGWANRITSLLGTHALRVPNGTLREKVKYINERTNGRPDIAVEIHFNSFKMWRDQNANGIIDDGEMVNAGRGSETLYYPSSVTGEALALEVQSGLGALAKPDRGIKEGWYQMNKSKGADFFLARTKCTSIIIEPEFIDNLDVIENIKDAACHSIASSLLDYTS